MKRITLFTLLASFLLAACGSSSTAGPEKAVEAYLNALNEKNSTRLSTLSCADWEATALMELDSFQAVSTTLGPPHGAAFAVASRCQAIGTICTRNPSW